MTLRSRCSAILVAAVVLCLALPVGARAAESGDGSSSTTTMRDLPRTAAEADERDGGDDLGGPWVLGSAVAAGASVLVGGLWLQRRMRREAGAP